MKSTAEEFGHIIDCRMLTLDGKYFGLTEDQTLGLAEKFYLLADGMFAHSCLLSWRCSNRSIQKSSDITGTKIKAGEIFEISMLGDVKSEVVFNKTSLRAYDRRLKNDTMFYLGLTPPFSSADYPKYAMAELDPYRCSPQQLREALLKLFNIEGRCNMGLYRQHDLEACFNSASTNENTFSGEFFLEISCHCLGGELDETAEKLYEFSKSLVSEYANVNMTIGVFQSDRDWERYFGAPTASSGNTMLHEDEYVTKVGWANIISPQTACLLDSSEETVFSAPLRCERLENGAVCIRSDSAASGTTISDLKRIKMTIYPTLLPSIAEFDNDWPYFRSQWENVAVLDNELLTDGDKVIFRQNAK